MSALPARVCHAVVLSVLALGGAAQPGAAQGVAAVRVKADNDYFSFWLPAPQRSDNNYTHGLRLLVDIDGAPWWGRRFAERLAPCTPARRAGAACLSTHFELGQEIYTPVHDSPVPVPGERPYAGWLYVAATARASGDGGSHAVTLQLGVTGRPSLAEVVQTSFHRLNPHSGHPLGWAHQLAFEPGLQIAYERSVLLFDRSWHGMRVLELMPQWGVVVGNIRTGAQAGLTLRVGYNVPRTSASGRLRGERPLALYAVGAVHQRWVARDLFLDGNTFRASPRVHKKPLVTVVQVGAGLRFGRTRIEYLAVASSRAYRTQPRPHRYGSIIVSIHHVY